MQTETFDITVRGHAFRVREMSFREAREHSKEGREMLQQNATGDEFYDRVLKTLAKHVDGEWTAETLQDAFGKRTIDDLYSRLLEISGLKSADADAGGAKAA